MKSYILISIFFLSCATTEKPKVNKQKNTTWIQDSRCMKDGNICALGYGKDQTSADLKAKKELAAFFRSKISSDLNNLQLAKQTQSKREFYERTSIVMSELVDDYIESVFIDKRGVDKGLYYALARLDKNNLNARLSQRYEDIRNRIKILNSFPYRSSLYNLKSLLEQKSQLDSIYSSLNSAHKISSENYTNFISLQKVYKKKKVFTQIEKSVESFSLSQVSEKLRSVGHSIVKSKSLADVILSTRLEMDNVHLNVKGFKKFKVNVQIESHHLNANTQGEIQFSRFITGRSRSDALVKAHRLIESEINEKFYLLKI